MAKRTILMHAETLLENLSEPDWRVIDCRFDLADPGAGRTAYERGHIPGAVYLDLDRDLAGPVEASTGRHPLPDVSHFEAALGAAGIGNHHNVVVYDDASGSIAARAWWLMHWLGHDRLWLLDGGFRRWQSKGLPEVKGQHKPAPERFKGRPRPELVITTEELEGYGNSLGHLKLVDARDRARFRGDHEPIDPVAGHIPGARNLPYGESVDEDGRWLSLARRERLLLDVLEGDRNADWCVMCGSGVTACHLAISALEAGLREPRVYVGSWSEWIRDPMRAVAHGDQ